MTEDQKALIDNYVHHRIPTGGAFQSIIEGRPLIWKFSADTKLHLASIMEYVFNTVPEQARGSRENYKAWCGSAEKLPWL
jgi:hypothetical protein